jgi:hypothetical protein
VPFFLLPLNIFILFLQHLNINAYVCNMETKAHPIDLKNVRRMNFDQDGTIWAFKEGLKDKFGTVLAFTKALGMRYVDLFNLLSAKRCDERTRDLKHLLERAIEMDGAAIYEGDITDYERTEIRGAIYKNYRTVNQFSDLNPQFDRTWISSILRERIVKRTDKTRELIKFLNIPPEKKEQQLQTLQEK